MSSSVQQFAQQHNLVIRRDSCGDLIVPGKRADGKRKEDCSHVFDTVNGLGACFMFMGAKKWGFVRRALEPTGAQLRQNGDTEGTFIFDPENPVQVAMVIKAAGLKRVRHASPATPAQLAARDAFAQSRKVA